MALFHLFDVFGDHYLFITGNRSIVRLETEEYETLSAMVDEKGGLKLSALSDSHNPLSQKILIEIKKIGSDRMANEEKPVAVEAVAINVARTCNLRCSYCYAAHGSYAQKSMLMSTTTAMSVVEFLDRIRTTDQGIQITFFGGEPLLNFKAIEKIVANAGKADTFSISTNATLIGEDHISFFRRQRFSVLVSCDGLPEYHDRNRRFGEDEASRGSSDKVVKAIASLVGNLGGQRVTLRATVADTDYDFPANAKYLLSLGPGRIGFTPASIMNDYDELLRVTIAGLRDILRRAIIHGEREILAGIENFRCFWPRFEDEVQIFDFCGAGSRYFAIDADGKFYLCHRFSGREKYILGSARQGWLEVAADLRSNVDDNLGNDCQSCWIKTLCYGGCRYIHDFFLGTLSRKHRPTCDYLRALAEMNIVVYDLLSSEHPQGHL